MLQTSKHPVFGALFGVALIQGVLGYIGYNMYSPYHPWTWVEWLITLGGGIYLVLALVSFALPRTASFIGGAIYGVYLAYQAWLNPAQLFGGWIFKGPIVILLIYAVISALRKARGPVVPVQEVR